MFSRIRGFLSRHRRKFIVSGIIVGGAVLATRYAQRKLREWQERETKEFLERTRRQVHFESTERTCNQLVFSLSPKVMETISKTVNTEKLVGELRHGPANKVALWEELKILAFTRACVVVYAFAMLVVTLRVQLNLIGGYMCTESDKTQGPPPISSVVQEKYLSLVHHFMGKGVKDLCILIGDKVKYVVGSISLKRRLNLNDTEQLLWAIQAAVSSDNNDPIKNMAHFVLPPDSASITSEDSSVLNTMIIETLDMLESEEVSSLTSSLVSQGFSHIVDRISEYFVSGDAKSLLTAVNEKSIEPTPGPSTALDLRELKNGYANSVSNFIHPNNVEMPMAKLIPIINGLGHQTDKPDSWVQQLILDDRVKMLGANVYEAFGYKK